MPTIDRDTVFVHFDAAFTQETLLSHPSCPDEDRQGNRNSLDGYCQWASGFVGTVFALFPEELRGASDQIQAQLSHASPVWYDKSSGHMSLADGTETTTLWLANGLLLPIVNWDEIRAAVKRHSCDALFFGPPGSVLTSQYPESLVVDETGKVLRVERHYFDSPVFTNLLFGPACFLCARGDRVRDVVGHVLQHGWDLDSIRSLTERVGVEWCTTPAVLSTSDGVSPAREPSWSGPHTVGGAGVSPPPSKYPATAGSMPNPFSLSRENRTAATGVSDAYFSATQSSQPRNRTYLVAKRTMDIMLSVVGMVVLSPLLVLAALFVKLTSPGPVFYADLRQGRGGKEFYCLKFRTMIPEAARMQADLRGVNEVDGPQFKLSDDPRLTRFGKWLRRYNIDELPQLFNVLMGQMSLVGPRPSPDRENQLCPGWRRTRLSVRPGITGLWQVLRLRRGEASAFQEWIYYDLEYIRYRSLWLDSLILLYTPMTVFAPGLLAGLARRLARQGICSRSDHVHVEKARSEPSVLPPVSGLRASPGKVQSD